MGTPAKHTAQAGLSNPYKLVCSSNIPMESPDTIDFISEDQYKANIRQYANTNFKLQTSEMFQAFSSELAPLGILWRDSSLYLISEQILWTKEGTLSRIFWNFLRFLSIQIWYRETVNVNLVRVALRSFPLREERRLTKLDKVCGCQIS